MEKLLTVNDLVELLQMEKKAIYGFIKSGDLKGVKFGKEWRFNKEEVERFLREGTKKQDW